MSSRTSTFPLRLPASLKAAVEKLAAMDGTSANQFLVMAAAEKIASIQTAEGFFAERRGRGNPKTAIRFLTRKGGERPRAEDELPSGRH
jgi:hypothetical protein